MHSLVVFLWRMRAMIAGIVLVSAVLVYAGAYYRLSRHGLEEAAAYGLKGFFYIPADEVLRTQDLTRQRRWCLFFAPANWVDRHLFDGPTPITSIMFRLS